MWSHHWYILGMQCIQMSGKVQGSMDGCMGVGFTSISGTLLSCTMSHGCGGPALGPRLPVHNRRSVLLILPLRHVVIVLHEDLQGQRDPSVVT